MDIAWTSAALGGAVSGVISGVLAWFGGRASVQKAHNRQKTRGDHSPAVAAAGGNATLDQSVTVIGAQHFGAPAEQSWQSAGLAASSEARSCWSTFSDYKTAAAAAVGMVSIDPAALSSAWDETARKLNEARVLTPDEDTAALFDEIHRRLYLISQNFGVYHNVVKMRSQLGDVTMQAKLDDIEAIKVKAEDGDSDTDGIRAAGLAGLLSLVESRMRS